MQIKAFQPSVSVCLCIFCCIDTPIFRSIDRVTPNCCYKLLKSLQTCPNRSIKMKNLRYAITPEASNFFINEGSMVKFLPSFQPYQLRNIINKHLLANYVFVLWSNMLTNNVCYRRYHIWISIKYRVNRYYRNIAQPYLKVRHSVILHHKEI